MRYLLLVPLIVVVLAVVGLLLPVLRWGFRLAVAAVAALLASLFLPPGEGRGWVPPAVFAGVLLLLSARRRRDRRRPRPRPAAVTIDAAPAEPRGSWAELRRLADWSQRRRLDAARDACARYLALAATEEGETAQLPLRLRRLPEVIDECVRHCRTATRDEQRQLVSRTLATAEALADQAERRRRELAHQAQSRFRALEAHLNRADD